MPLLEKAISILCAITEDYMIYPGKIESWNIVIDTQELGIARFPMQAFQNMIRTLQDNFPCLLEKLYVLKPSLSVNLNYQNQIESFISPLTQAKIFFLKHSELNILQ